MKRKMRFPVGLVGIAGLALALWFLLPGPFVHGMIVGVASIVGLLAGVVFFFGRRMRKRMGSVLPPPPVPTASWDYSMKLTDPSGTPIDASRFSGRVLVLNFWATWCAPCLAEMPSLRGLRDRTTDLDVQFALVTREPPTTVGGFLTKRELGLPVYLLAEEPPDCFKARAIPATFVLDKEGRIAMRHFGAAKWDDDGVVAFVRGLAATPGVGSIADKEERTGNEPHT